MSDENGTSQGVHYHYHFYGYGPEASAGFAPQGAPEAAPAPQGAPAGGYGASAQQGPAGAFPPGFPPPGFPFGPGAAPGAASSQNAQAQQGAGLNWHQHPAADSLIKGLAVGAGAAYLLTNETAQRTILRTAVQIWSFLQGGVEELKERLHDAEAEVAAAAAPAPVAPVEPEAEAPLAPFTGS